jgi:cellulose synthase/poly-beta-1,6-N-acetylglucosamine synthase-like glycosyltransferase
MALMSTPDLSFAPLSLYRSIVSATFIYLLIFYFPRNWSLGGDTTIVIDNTLSIELKKGWLCSIYHRILFFCCIVLPLQSLVFQEIGHLAATQQ